MSERMGRPVLPRSGDGRLTNAQIDQWIKALRSGEYQQSKNDLREGSCFCALGVLCNILDPFGWTLEDGEYSHRLNTSRYFCNEAEEIVTYWNDHDGRSFAEIAELLDIRRDEFTGATDLYGD